MKKIFFLLLIISFLSCEEVVQVDLNEAPPRLVIDAAIDWEKGTLGNRQVIKLSTSTGYYNSVIPTVSNAIITVTNLSTNQTFTFIEDTPGSYICNDFIPLLNNEYKLSVLVNNQTYEAIEKLTPVPEITRVEQRSDVGFTGEDIEVKFFFNDNPNENNFYLDRYNSPTNAFPLFDTFDDRFTQGNEMFSLYFDEDIKQGDTIELSLFGISETYFNYMSVLIGQTGVNNGGPFQTPPATVRGNIVNQTNFSNFCFGYFRCTEFVKQTYTIQ